ncbi:MAG: YdcF family protein [Clostridia bacterium]|nr:YdcF family protein [Clostridia bacterium]
MIVKIILLLAGLFLFLNGAVMSLISNFNLGVILTVAAGLGFLLWGVFYRRINEKTKNGWLKWAKRAVIALVCIEIALVAFLAYYGQFDNCDYTEDAVIVLGAGIRGDRVTVPLAYRLNSAIEYHKKNPDAVIVVTGGQGYQETITEAEAMEKYLLRKGVDPHKIIKEEKATSTNENMRFSKEILDKYFEGDYSIVVVTNNFHVYRGVQIAKIEGFENVYRKHAGLKWYNMAPCYIRESLAVLKMWVFDMLL